MNVVLLLVILSLSSSFINADRYFRNNRGASYNVRNSWGNNKYKWGNSGFGARYTSRYNRRPSYTFSYQDDEDMDFGLPFSAGVPDEAPVRRSFNEDGLAKTGGLGNNFYWGGYYDDYPSRYVYPVGN